MDFDYKQMGDQWYKYVEYWHQDIKDYIYYFESYEHLRDILKKSYAEMDWEKNVRQRGPVFYSQVRKQSLSSWSKILLSSTSLNDSY